MNHTGGGILDRFPNHATGYSGAGSMGFSSMYIFAPELGDSVIMIRNFAGKAAIQPPANQIMGVVLGVNVGPAGSGDDESE